MMHGTHNVKFYSHSIEQVKTFNLRNVIRFIQIMDHVRTEKRFVLWYYITPLQNKI